MATRRQIAPGVAREISNSRPRSCCAFRIVRFASAYRLNEPVDSGRSRAGELRPTPFCRRNRSGRRKAHALRDQWLIRFIRQTKMVHRRNGAPYCAP
jgi:hypothetical protein